MKTLLQLQRLVELSLLFLRTPLGLFIAVMVLCVPIGVGDYSYFYKVFGARLHELGIDTFFISLVCAFLSLLIIFATIIGTINNFKALRLTSLFVSCLLSMAGYAKIIAQTVNLEGMTIQQWLELGGIVAIVAFPIYVIDYIAKELSLKTNETYGVSFDKLSNEMKDATIGQLMQNVSEFSKDNAKNKTRLQTLYKP